ncbi:AlpA family phage regulatory protein [Mannheimia sp. AT1]|uniref:AlpA family phage regulatory protein n=1 Tax=Mannheimia cairinae TaxID=3025936 RepID=A0ABT5MLM0_9PAST|nr:AlpA family phage regulatory protein [Mannheimia cairinae]MDD0823094.1 AlpA family phage regulatory protein [Mannheimia cairinae]MDD0825881.1 AlpA family phage regulatory protein [Mannheimia cairinae]
MENTAQKQRFMKIDEVSAVTTLSETQIYRKMKVGDFPESISIGANSKVWLESEIQQWMNSKIEQHRNQ